MRAHFPVNKYECSIHIYYLKPVQNYEKKVVNWSSVWV